MSVPCVTAAPAHPVYEFALLPLNAPDGATLEYTNRYAKAEMSAAILGGRVGCGSAGSQEARTVGCHDLFTAA